MKIYSNVLEMIGNTPIVEIHNVDTGPCRLFLKLEGQNPGGSVKDRIARAMVAAAERSGKLQPGGTIVEATAGNTGVSLALVAALKGYRLLIVLPDKMSKEKIYHLQAFGADVVMTRSDVAKGHPEYYQDLAERLVSEMDNAVYINQFANEANPQAHAESTGPEIWQQMGHDVDAIVCGVGTGGTVTGVSRYLKTVAPNVEYVLADPQGSILADYVNKGVLNEKSGTWLVEGIGEDFIPSICDLSVVKKAYTVTDKQSFLTGRELLRKEGIFAGSCTGTILHAALQYCREQTTAKRVVAISGDSGYKYLTKMYNDYWMMDQGFLQRETHGDLRDIIARFYSEHAVVKVAPNEPLSTAHARMKMHDISQLPVIEDDRVIGIINESDLLMAVTADKKAFKTPVREVMSTNLHEIAHDASVNELKEIFKESHVAMVMQDKQFLGLITRLDLVNYLRRQLEW